MIKGWFYFFLIALACTSNVSASKFYACKSKYALCTTAPCTPVAGKKDVVSCHCKVVTGYSAGAKQCQDEKKTKKGILINSRYYPVKSYARCSNSRPWAWCLDKPCLIDKKDPSSASCACSVVSNLGDYVIVTNKNTPSTCTTGIISSATIDGITDITNFLKTQDQPKPFPIKVLKEI